MAILLACTLPIENAIQNTKFRSFLAYFTRQKQFFFKKCSKSARQTHFFQKKNFFYLILGFFNKFYQLGIIGQFGERSAKIEVEDRI